MTPVEFPYFPMVRDRDINVPIVRVQSKDRGYSEMKTWDTLVDSGQEDTIIVQEAKMIL